MSTAGDRFVVVGASTGGTEALRVLLAPWPVDGPGVVVVLHMPERFAAGFAARLALCCAVRVQVADDGAWIERGSVLIVPDGRHAVVERAGNRYRIRLRGGVPVCRHRPSVDVLFRSAASAAGARAVGVILTGMGDDGARGLRRMRERGATTIAQDEESCVVFGMPRAAIALGAAAHVLPLARISAQVVRALRGRATSE
jgi:two-component system chemotaxis response regulator CheB